MTTYEWEYRCKASNHIESGSCETLEAAKASADAVALRDNSTRYECSVCALDGVTELGNWHRYKNTEWVEE